MNALSDRARYIDGLRVLASVLEQNPDLPLPLTGAGEHFEVKWLFYSGDDGTRAAMARMTQAVPCAWRKEFREADPDGQFPAYFDLLGQVGGLRLKLTAHRDVVCTKVVTGTREVTEEVLDPEALAKVPVKKVTRTVEDYSWECGSLLAPVEDRQPAALAGGGA